ncbi:MAG: outer membrane beta-barrel protein [Draconibacterium sp.]
MKKNNFNKYFKAKRTVVVLFLLLCSTFTYAKEYQVFGKIRSVDTKQAIEFATIAVKHPANDSIITSMITDSKGEFSFACKTGNYKLAIQCLGYKPFSQIIKLTKTLYLPTIEMETEINEISQVTVEASNYNEKYDRSIQVITKQFKEGTNKATDLLEKLRGVQVDPLDNSITVNNEKSVLLLVDGIQKEQNLIKNLPPDRILRIEVIRNPTGRYISQGYTSVINIILKKNYTGYNLLAEQQGLYSLDNSNGDDFLFKNNITTSLSYTFKKLNMYGSYLRNKSNTNLCVENFKEIENASLDKISPNKTPNVERDGLAHTFVVGADLFINTNQTLSFESNFINSPYNKNTSIQAYDNELKSGNINEMFTSGLNNAKSEKAQYYLLSYRNKFSDKNKLELDYGSNVIKSKTLNSYFEDNQELNKQEIEFKNHTSVFDANFEHTFSSTYALELGYRNTYRTYRYISLPSAHKVENKDIRHLGYSYLSIAPKGKVKSKIGLAFEQNTLMANEQTKNYYSLQPFMSVFYNHSRKLNITLKLNSSSSYPYAEQINPVETTIDRLTTTTGNPKLGFASIYTGSIDFKLFNNRLSIEPYYSRTIDFISKTGHIYNDSYRYTYSNLDKYESAGVKASTRLSLIPRKMFVDFTGSLYFDKTEFEGHSNHVNDFTIKSNLMYISKHRTLYALMFKRMNAKQIQAYGHYSNDNDYLGLFLKQPFLKQRLNLSLLYILPINKSIEYVMEDHYADNSFKEKHTTDVSILTNLLMVKLTFNLTKGNEVQSIKKKNYKEKKETKGFF